MIIKHKLDGITGERLRQLHDAPKEFYFKGVDPNLLLERPSVSIVGSRKMTPYGRAVTEKLATELARAGVVVISGLAFGVDSAAHQATLDAGGLTLAVMAHGLHTVQPSSHTALARSILDKGGSLVSEYPEGVDAFRYTFVARDRLIAALADAVLVPEAAIKSGALHTAAFALDLGKPVMAVPGPISSEMSAGTNQLIKTGAIPVTSVEDVFHSLGIEGHSIQQTLAGLTPQETAIVEALKTGASEGLQLLKASQLKSQEFAQTLTMLEINGHIRSLGGDQWALA